MNLEQYNQQLRLDGYPPLPEEAGRRLQAIDERKRSLIEAKEVGGDEWGALTLEEERIAYGHCESVRQSRKTKPASASLLDEQKHVTTTSSLTSQPQGNSHTPLINEYFRLKSEEANGGVTAGTAFQFWKDNRQGINRERSGRGSSAATTPGASERVSTADTTNSKTPLLDEYSRLKAEENRGQAPPGRAFNFWRSNRKAIDQERFSAASHEPSSNSGGNCQETISESANGIVRRRIAHV